MPARPPMITIGSTVRLPQAGQAMTVARVIVRDEDGQITATVDLRPCVDFAPATSPWEPPPHASPAERAGVK